MYPSDQAVKHLLRFAKDAGATVASVRNRYPHSMLSHEEVLFLELFASSFNRPVRVAELGCYIGGTTCILGDATFDRSLIEVYDLFIHNEVSRSRLRDNPLYDEHTFFEIWKKNVSAHKEKIILNRGDVKETSMKNVEPLDVVYIDIVKHQSVVNSMKHFYGRLNVGGFVLHQDYFHWQSPWVVYQMEYLKECFHLIGDVGLNMNVYRKVKNIDKFKDTDFLSISTAEIFALFDEAISRYAASKAGMLKVSKLRLAMDLDTSLESEIIEDIQVNHAASPRVMRYFNALMSSRGRLSTMW